MPNYRYRAVAPDGSALEDVIDAPTAHQATLRLQERGYTVTALEPVQGEFSRGNQLSWPDLEFLVRQLLSITQRNLPMVPALKAMTADMDSPKLKGVIDQVRIDLERGSTIEEALRNRGSAVPPLFASAVRAGEASGLGLPGVLKILVQHAGRMVRIQASLQAALAYPLVVVCMAIAVLFVLFFQYLPTIQDVTRNPFINEHGHQRGISILVQNYAPYLLAGGTLLLIGSYVATRRIRRGFSRSLSGDRLRLQVPGFGRVYYLITIARFSRTLAALLAARVSIVEALELAAAASGSPMLEQAVGEAIPRVAMGETLTSALLSTDYFGKAYCWLLGVAEERNAMEEALENLAESAERDAAAQDRTNLQLVGPIALIVAGIAVLLVSAQFLMPISSAVSDVSRF